MLSLIVIAKSRDPRRGRSGERFAAYHVRYLRLAAPAQAPLFACSD
jgi:hypothetical protein